MCVCVHALAHPLFISLDKKNEKPGKSACVLMQAAE